MSNGTVDPYESLVPSRRKAIQQADTTIPTPPQPPEVDPYKKVLDDTAYDPYEAVLNPTPDSVSRRLSFLQGQRELSATVPGTPPSFLQRHPFVNMIAETAKSIAEMTRTFVLNAADAGMRNRARVMGSSGLPQGAPEQTDPTKPIRTRDYYETYGEWLTRRQAEGDPDATERMHRTIEGTALTASMLGGEIVASTKLSPAIRTLLGGGRAAGLVGKWASFTVGEALGGGIFGGIRDREEDESRLSAILGDATTFAILGVGGKAVLEFIPGAYKRYILAMPRAKRIVALQRVARGLDEVDASLAHGNTSLDQLPAEHRIEIETPVLEGAIRSVDEDFPKFVSRVVSDHLAATPRPTLDDDFAKALQDVREKRAATRARRAETARARRAAKRVSPPEEPPPEGGAPAGGPPAEPPPPAPPAGAAAAAAPAAAPAEESVDLIAPPSKTAPQGFSARVSPNTVPGEGPWKLAEFEGPRPSPEDAGAYQHFPTKEAALDAAAELGYRPMPAGEFITGPVVRGHSGKLYVNGETHGAIMESARAVGVPKGEFEGIGANHPNRGFRTNVQDFIDRETAGKMTGFPGRLFSEDLHAMRATPLESTISADTQIEDVAQQIAHATEPEAKEISEAAILDVATDRAVASIRPLDIASSDIKDAAANTNNVIDLVAEMKKRGLTPEAIVDESIDNAMSKFTDSGQAEEEIVQHLTHPTPEDLASEAELTPHEQVRSEVKKAPKEPPPCL